MSCKVNNTKDQKSLSQALYLDVAMYLFWVTAEREYI